MAYQLGCQPCKFWSDLLAKAGGATPTGQVQAVCLNHDGPNYMRYMYRHDGCDKGEAGPSIDIPEGR
jgi:hypothetical protein